MTDKDLAFRKLPDLSVESVNNNKLYSRLQENERTGKQRVQDFAETYALCKLLIQRKLRRVLEIGTGGGSTPVWELLLEERGRIVTIDINTRFSACVRRTCDPSLVKFIVANSLDKETVGKVKTYFNYGTVDFLFIDGEHDYNNVKSDYLNFRPFVKQGGIIALHDEIMEGPKRVLREAKEEGFQTHVIGKACGIGIVFV